MFSEAFKHVCMFKIPLPVMENAQPRLSKTIDNCFSLNHVCMFEKSPKPLCLSCFLQFGLNGTQRMPSIFQIFKKIQCEILRPPSVYVCMSQTAKHLCMSQTYIHTLSCLKHTYIHTLSDFSVKSCLQRAWICSKMLSLS